MSADSSRRQFLRRAAVAAAMTLPITNLRLRAAQASEPVLRWGVIGTGKRAIGAHIPAIASFEQMKILAVCDVMENHLEQGAAKAGGAVERYRDYQRLLANRDINAVMIATPNLLHKEMVLAALDAGKHVMCEKPMAVSYDQCKAMKRAGEERPSQVVLYTMQLRYSQRWSELRKAIEAGKIGRPRYAIFAEHRGDWAGGDVWKYQEPRTGKAINWRYSHAATGGTLNEKVCHYFDILNWMADAVPQRVLCSGGINVYNDGRDTWDHASTTMDYPGGFRAIHGLCMYAPNRLDLQIVGDEASIHVMSDHLLLHARKGKPEPLALPQEVLHGQRRAGQETAVLRMYQDFLDCVQNNKQPWMDADKAMASSKIAWLGELSSEKQKAVQWEEIT